MSTTTVKASYKAATLSAYYKPEDIDDVLRRIDDMVAAKNSLTRASARQFVISTMKSNGHLPGKPKAHLVAHTLLWLACRSEAGETALAAAKKGGTVIEYQITGEGLRANFRLIVREGPDLDLESISEALH